jgi:hypothetical protein
MRADLDDVEAGAPLDPSGGNTWTAEQRHHASVQSLYFADADNGWLAGTDLQAALETLAAHTPRVRSFPRLG